MQKKNKNRSNALKAKRKPSNKKNNNNVTMRIKSGKRLNKNRTMALARNVLLEKRRSTESFSTAPVHKRFGNGVRISGTDWLGDVTVVGNISPGTILYEDQVVPEGFIGTRLTQLAPLWERYEVVKWEFCYIPSVSGIVNGQFIAYPEYDPLDVIPTDPIIRQREAFSAMDNVIWNVYDEAKISFLHVDPFTDLYTDNRGSDPRLSSVGKFVMMNTASLNSAAAPDGSFGSFVMRWTIDFFIPQLSIPSVVLPDTGYTNMFTPLPTDLGFGSGTSEQGVNFVSFPEAVPLFKFSDSSTSIATRVFEVGDILTGIIRDVAVLSSTIQWQDTSNISIGDQVFIKIVQAISPGYRGDTIGGPIISNNALPHVDNVSALGVCYSTLREALKGTSLVTQAQNFIQDDGYADPQNNKIVSIASDSMLFNIGAALPFGLYAFGVQLIQKIARDVHQQSTDPFITVHPDGRVKKHHVLCKRHPPSAGKDLTSHRDPGPRDQLKSSDYSGNIGRSSLYEGFKPPSDEGYTTRDLQIIKLQRKVALLKSQKSRLKDSHEGLSYKHSSLMDAIRGGDKLSNLKDFKEKKEQPTLSISVDK